MNNKRSGKPRRSQNFWPLVLIAAVSAVFLSPLIADWVNVAPPSAAIARLATVTTMTREAQQIFYRQTPTIDPKPTFFSTCQNAGKKLDDKLIAFGCYVSNGRSGKISLQAVVDPRFQGIIEVAAAHEMLHAVYDRLSPSDRETLTPRLKKAALRVKDSRLSSVLKQYEATDTKLFVNELHSHLGTELGDLDDAELERHYQRYFSDRQQVIAFAQQSQAALHQLDNKAKQLKAEIDAFEADLKPAKQALKGAEQDLESSQQNLDAMQANLVSFREQAEQSYRQGVGSPNLVTQFEQMRAQYNEQVRQHNDRVQQHQTDIAAFKAKVDQYKQKVNAFNSNAHEARAMLDELDANPARSRALIDDISQPVNLKPNN